VGWVELDFKMSQARTISHMYPFERIIGMMMYITIRRIDNYY